MLIPLHHRQTNTMLISPVYSWTTRTIQAQSNFDVGFGFGFIGYVGDHMLLCHIVDLVKTNTEASKLLKCWFLVHTNIVFIITFSINWLSYKSLYCDVLLIVSCTIWFCLGSQFLWIKTEFVAEKRLYLGSDWLHLSISCYVIQFWGKHFFLRKMLKRKNQN